MQQLKTQFDAETTEYQACKVKLDAKTAEHQEFADSLNTELAEVKSILAETNQLIQASNTLSKEATAEHEWALEFLVKLTGNDLLALREVTEPSEALKSTMFALLAFMGKTSLTWESVQTALTSADFMQSAVDVNP